MGIFIRHEPCEKCGSSDAKAVYNDGSWHCWSCRATKASEDYKEQFKNKFGRKERKEKPEVKEPITKEQIREIVSTTSTEGKGFRGIRNETYAKFGVRHEFDEETGEVVKQYYPITKEGTPAGYKVRVVEGKEFYSKGSTGRDCDMFMQRHFASPGKYCLITEGECFPDNTEVLTRNGWVTLADYSVEMGEVMQANGEFAMPLAKVHKQYDGNLVSYSSGSYHCDMTPEHNMLRVTADGKMFKVKAADPRKKSYRVPRTMNVLHKTFSEEEEVLARIQVMVSADFTFREGGDIYGCFKKQRKIDRCIALLDKAGVRYSANRDSRGYMSVFIHRGHGLDVSKLFSFERDLEKSHIILDEVLHWDGNRVPDRNQIEYSSALIQNATFIQTCAHLNGYVSTIIPRSNQYGNWYKVSILYGKQTSSTQKGYTEKPYSGKVGCLTMPDGTLMVRFNRSISLSGNCDSLAAYQMMSDYYTSKGTTFEVACVSATTGANSQRQIQNQYKFFDQFDNIVICYDNDEAGKAATEEIVKVLPKGKIKIMHLQMKDANEYLKAEKQAEFVRAFFSAEHYVPVGVVGSGMLYERVLNQATMPKIPFPYFMKALNEAMAGGMVLGHTYNIASGTGLGKCLGKDTPVLMSDFSVKMVQDIVNGEKVMGPDGLPRIVSGVTSGTAQLYKIKQSDGEDYVVNSDHILSLRNQEGEIWNVNVEEFILESRFNNHQDTWFGWAVYEWTETGPLIAYSYINVVPHGFGEYYGFQVDKDHLFCLGDGTVTHNTTFINEIIYSWIFNSPYRIGIVSMELDSAQYGEVLLSRHMSKKIALFDDPTEKDKYLRSEHVVKKAQELFFDDDEQHRFYVLDNRDGTVEEIQNAVEELVISCACKVIIIDPLQDVLDGLSVDEQAVFMKWVKGMQKSHGIAIVLINHLRKSASGAPSSSKGEDFTEEDIIGSSSIIKSASVNILLSRNKYSDDPVVRNTTKVRVSKNRLTGITGPVGNVYYDNESHTLHDFEEYWGKAQPTEDI